jgi:hypothetical protein
MNEQWNGMSRFDRFSTIIIGILSLYVVIQLALDIVIVFSSAQEQLFGNIDLAICSLFIADWLRGLVLSEKKLRHCAVTGWIWSLRYRWSTC